MLRGAVFSWTQCRIPGVRRGVVCVILRLAVSVQQRLVTDRQMDGQTDRQTDTRRQLIPALASVARVMIMMLISYAVHTDLGMHMQ